ncbi:MAG: TonB C-terminal domain-containing protein [Burkholderiales bacterium]|nr:TonB C-terminal domain-containing protein [Opitutaceae bacterium]
MAAFSKTRIDATPEAREPDARGFGAAGGASLALHAGVAALLIGTAWLTLREPTPEVAPEGFRLMESGGAASAYDAPDVTTDNSGRAVTMSATERLFTPPPSLRPWTPPPPPRVLEQSQPSPSSPPARTEPARDSRTISYEEHLRRQGAAPDTRRPRSGEAQTVARVGTGTRINVDKVHGGLGDQAVSRHAADGAVESAMAGYFADLVGRLRDEHELPKGVDSLWKTEVQFTLAANGAVSDVRILRASGSKEFDQSVIEAFGRLKMTARPDGKTDVRRLTFRIAE